MFFGALPMTRWRDLSKGACFVLSSLSALHPLHAQPVHGKTLTTLGQQVVLRANASTTSPAHNTRSLYVLHCAGCHSLDGSGSVSARVPDLRQLGRFLQVPGGRVFLIQVPGVLGSGLNDEQVAEVTNWVLNTLAPNSMPTGFEAYTSSEVTQARRTPLADVATQRAQLGARAQALGVALSETP